MSVMPAMLHQLHRLHTSGDVQCALDCVRALPEYQHRFFIKLSRGVDPRLPAQLAALDVPVRLGATVGADDLTADAVAVLYHCIGYDEARPGDYVSFTTEPAGVTCAAWIHTPGRCGQPGKRPRYGFLAGRGLSRLIFNSTFTRDQTPELDRAGMTHCAVIAPTAAGNQFRSVVRTDAGFRIGRWSRGDDRKYADDYLEVVAALTRAIPDLQVECMGIPRKFRGRTLPAGMQLWENHALPLEQLLGRLDVLLYKTDARTWDEGWCRTVTEAMAAGVVPVLERRGGVTDQVIDGQTGHLCATNAEFTAACEALYRDPALRARLSANCRAFVQRHFTLARLRHDLLTLLDPPAPN